MVLSVLDAVYIDAKKSKSIVAIKPKPPFIPIFRVAVSKQDSDIRILNEPLETPSKVPSVFLVETGEGSYHTFNIFGGALSRISLGSIYILPSIISFVKELRALAV